MTEAVEPGAESEGAGDGGGPETFFVPSSDGVTIAVHDYGGPAYGPTGGAPATGAGEVLVVCHATGFCGRAYDPLAHALTDRYHVYAVDFRGHGYSSAPANGNYDWRDMADDLRRVLGEIGGGRPVVGFGHSLGGGLLVHAEAAEPGLLQAAYLFEPIVLPREVLGPIGDAPANSNFMAANARRRRPSFPSKAEALYRYASRPPLSVLQAGALSAYVEHGMSEEPDGSAVLRCTPENEAACFDGLGKPTYDTARNVKVPVVVAIGEIDDQWTPAAMSLGLVDVLPEGELERHPLLGHFGPLQGPKTIANAVLAALG